MFTRNTIVLGTLTTTFLAGTGLLDKKGRIEATSCLQSKARPEVFGAGVTNIPLLGHPASARVAAQAVTCVHNARLFLSLIHI